MDFKLQYRRPNIFWCLGVSTKKNFFVISHTYLRCLIQMAQYHNNKEKNNESWSKIIILSCQNKIQNKSLKWMTLMYIYILPVHHCSILAKSFLRRLKNNNIFTLQLGNPDSFLPSAWPYENGSRFEEYYDYSLLIVPILRIYEDFAAHLYEMLRDLHNVSNVSITMHL